MMVLSFCNHKGGTGKTTSALHVAAALGLSGYRTIMVDLDPQGYLTRMLGVDEPDSQNSSRALFEYDAALHTIPRLQFSSFDLLPSSTSLTHHMQKLNNSIDTLWVREAIERSEGYDVVILDTAAAVTVYSLNAMVGAHCVIIPVSPEFQGVEGAMQTFETASMIRKRLNPGLADTSFLLTQVDGRKRAHSLWREFLRMRYGNQVLRSVIRTNAPLARKCDNGETVFEIAPYSRGALDYANTTDEIIQRMNLRRLT